MPAVAAAVAAINELLPLYCLDFEALFTSAVISNSVQKYCDFPLL